MLAEELVEPVSCRVRIFYSCDDFCADFLHSHLLSHRTIIPLSLRPIQIIVTIPPFTTLP